MAINAQIVPTAPKLTTLKDSEEVRKSLLNLAAQINEQIRRLDDGVQIGQVNSDWNAVSGPAEILNKPALLQLGETSTTAYRGDRGKVAYDHSQTTGNPHGATQDDIPDGITYAQFSIVEQTKLSGIEAGAQVNVPTDLSLGTRTATGIPVNSSTGADVTLPAATTTLAGLESAADKTKLDGIEAGAQVNVPTDLSLGTRTATGIPVNSSTGTDVTLPVATTTLAGLESAADKTKLDGIAAGAEVNVNADWAASSGDAQILNKPAALASIGALTPAADRLPYYTSASAAALATFTAFARTLLDDADAATMRSTLGALAAASYTAIDVLAKLLTVDTDTAGINATTIKSVTPGAGGLLLLALSALSSATPLMDGTAAAGSSNIPSRQDHVHPERTQELYFVGTNNFNMNYTGGDPVGTRKMFCSSSSGTGYINISFAGETIEGASSFIVRGSTVASTFSSPVTIEKVSATEWKFVDGIISGSNANGKWEKHSSGSMIQNVSGETPVSVPAGGNDIDLPYPVSFSGNPSVSGGARPQDSWTGVSVTVTTYSSSYTKETGCCIHVNTPVAQNFNHFNYIAVGPWR